MFDVLRHSPGHIEVVSVFLVGICPQPEPMNKNMDTIASCNCCQWESRIMVVDCVKLNKSEGTKLAI